MASGGSSGSGSGSGNRDFSETLFFGNEEDLQYLPQAWKKKNFRKYTKEYASIPRSDEGYDIGYHPHWKKSVLERFKTVVFVMGKLDYDNKEKTLIFRNEEFYKDLLYYLEDLRKTVYVISIDEVYKDDMFAHKTIYNVSELESVMFDNRKGSNSSKNDDNLNSNGNDKEKSKAVFLNGAGFKRFLTNVDTKAIVGTAKRLLREYQMVVGFVVIILLVIVFLLVDDLKVSSVDSGIDLQNSKNSASILRELKKTENTLSQTSDPPVSSSPPPPPPPPLPLPPPPPSTAMIEDMDMLKLKIRQLTYRIEKMEEQLLQMTKEPLPVTIELGDDDTSLNFWLYLAAAFIGISIICVILIVPNQKR